jgi:DNA-binding HxlR family transcriptional regulator
MWRDRIRFGTVIELMPLGTDYDRQTCSLARALEVVGERWTLLIVRDLFMGVKRFGELAVHLDIPRAVLSSRLDTLVEQGLVERRPYAPGRDEFHLTEPGRELWPALYALTAWGERHRCAGGGPRRLWLHAPCGTELDPGGACPSCGVTPAPEDVETRPGPGRDRPLREDAVSLALREPHRLLTPLAV